MNVLQSKRTNARIAIGVVLLLLPGGTRGDDVEDLVEALKPTPMDYAAWAGGLLKAAEGLEAKPKVQARLLEKAYEYGLKQAKGYPVAIGAARALWLADGGPAEAETWQRNLLAALRLDWQAADAVRKKDAGKAYLDQAIAMADQAAASRKAAEAQRLYAGLFAVASSCAPERKAELNRKLRNARDQEETERDLERCKRLLEASPANVAAREKAILLYVVELDDPAEANKLLTPEVSEQLRTYVPLAARKAEDRPKEVCIELGNWYRSIGGKATARGRANVLRRAKTCYERFLQAEADPGRAALGKVKLDQVKTELAQIDPDTGIMDLPPGQWVKLLDGARTDGWFAPKSLPGERPPGTVQSDDRSKVTTFLSGKNCTALHWTGGFPSTDYELAVEGCPSSGALILDVVIPIGKERCAFKLGGPGVGLELVDGKTLSDQNTTYKPFRVKPNQWYVVRFRVTPEKVEAWVNDGKVVDLPVQNHKFTVWGTHSEVKTVGIVSWATDWSFRSVTARRLK